MKTFFKIIFLILWLFSFILPNTVFSESEDEKIELLERYIKNYKKNINKLTKKYKIEKSEELLENLKSIDLSLEIIKKAKEKDLTNEEKNEIIKYLTKNLKDLNNKSKEILKKWKLEFEEKINKSKKYYHNLLLKLAEKLDLIIDYIYKTKLDNKRILNLKESILKENLWKLEKLSFSFRYFWNLEFSSEEDVKEKFKEIISETKKIILKIKSNLKD